MGFGTLDTLDTLRSTFETVREYGEERLSASIMTYVDAFNEQANRVMADLIEPTTDKERVFGTASTRKLVRTDQYGRPDVKKVTYGAVTGFPLESFQDGIGWTRKYFQTASVSEVTNQMVMMRGAYYDRIILEAKRALFVTTNYDFNDYLVDRRSATPIKVKRLTNADSQPIPSGPNGETYDSSTHTHYLGTSSFVVGDLTGALNTVLEHYNSGTPIIAINAAQEATVSGFTGFFPYQYPMVTPSTASSSVDAPRLNPVAIYNRPIGMFKGATVWIKPWMPASYVLCYITGGNKVLARRTREAGGGGLTLVADNENFPLRAENWEAEFGIGVQERTAASVLYTANATYTAPTLED